MQVIGTAGTFTLDGAAATTGQTTITNVTAGGGITVSMGTGTGDITIASGATGGNFTLDASTFGGTIDVRNCYCFRLLRCFCWYKRAI